MLCFGFVVLLHEIFDELLVVVVGCDVEDGAAFAIDYSVDLLDQLLEELFGVLLIETLDGLE